MSYSRWLHLSERLFLCPQVLDVMRNKDPSLSRRHECSVGGYPSAMDMLSDRDSQIYSPPVRTPANAPWMKESRQITLEMFWDNSEIYT